MSERHLYAMWLVALLDESCVLYRSKPRRSGQHFPHARLSGLMRGVPKQAELRQLVGTGYQAIFSRKVGGRANTVS